MNDDPAPAAATAKKPRTNLQERVISGLVLGAIVFALTWFGGAACSPSAWRTSESTMMMRVKLVIISTIAGMKLSSVISSSVWMVRL